MALKPPPLGDVLQQVNSFAAGPGGLKEEADKALRALAQSTLTKLDVVSREEYDAQTAQLKATQAQVAELENQLQKLAEDIAAME